MRTQIALFASDFPPANLPPASAIPPARHTIWYWVSPFRAVATAPALGELDFNPYQFQFDSAAATAPTGQPH